MQIPELPEAKRALTLFYNGAIVKELNEYLDRGCVIHQYAGGCGRGRRSPRKGRHAESVYELHIYAWAMGK